MGDVRIIVGIKKFLGGEKRHSDLDWQILNVATPDAGLRTSSFGDGN